MFKVQYSSALAAIVLGAAVAGLLQDFQQTVQATFIDADLGFRTHARLGVVGHGQASSLHHGNVIAAVAHGNALLRLDAQQAGHFQQCAALFRTVADIAPGLR